MNTIDTTSKKLKFTKEQKVKFSHCDFAGIVFYPRFLEMLNELVEDWFDEVLDFSFLKMHPNGGVPTVDLNIKFKSPARLGDVLIKTLWVVALSDKSVTYGFQFTNSDKIVLEGTAVLVNVELDKLKNEIKPKSWDKEVKSKMEMYFCE